jgi:hypothetical protein
MNERSNLFSESHEGFVSKKPCPKVSSIGIVVKAPEMNELVQIACIAHKITNQFVVKTPSTQGRPAQS